MSCGERGYRRLCAGIQGPDEARERRRLCLLSKGENSPGTQPMPDQPSLFDLKPGAPDGFRYRPNFLVVRISRLESQPGCRERADSSRSLTTPVGPESAQSRPRSRRRQNIAKGGERTRGSASTEPIASADASSTSCANA